MSRYAKKSKKEEEDALVRVVQEMLDNFENWRTECRTEEDFIDQALYPFLRNILLRDKNVSSTRSYEKIPYGHPNSDSSSSSSKAKPDFFVFLPIDDNSFGLLCVEVKKPGTKSSQILSDRSKLALECKRSIDHQVSLGVRTPKCFALFVDGEMCSSFVCELTSHGIYTFVELDVFSLPRGKMDLGSLPDTVLSFCWLKELINEQMSCIYKRRKTNSFASLTKLVTPTVALPLKKSNLEQ
ncbi:uncharacterized protein B0P05DRAFT_306841 [Gilbertella persicaria]|uniref:uncharacterized protein n=1 Tax=Gilbertella persicaria TaxID=101096 RepID=UPI00221FB0C8|nr:uncharacterized protein B0P05DRAFT_306841 [Gilbertella persicaria]KAI8053703.1 hypothetical protein B0P05DRAFT_306841 [Gilbertella persicaria]